MKMHMRKFILAGALLLGYCSDTDENTFQLADNENLRHNTSEFKDYWYAGEAELTSYELEQARYGEKRSGQAVLVFVTEDFLPDKQVKDESGSSVSTSVLKLNYTKKFYTGIYPYSMMTSIFTPVNDEDYPNTLKVSTSSQEWCGHTYLQINHKNDAYQITGHSYFENEADQELAVTPDFLEDEIWTQIRIEPASLPVGTFQVLPGSFYLRLKHKPMEPVVANCSVTESDGIYTYTIEYPSLSRTLSIEFEEAFPHSIQGWKETYPSGFGSNAQTMTSTATKTASIKNDYWNKNGTSDNALRDQLQLDYPQGW